MQVQLIPFRKNIDFIDFGNLEVGNVFMKLHSLLSRPVHSYLPSGNVFHVILAPFRWAPHGVEHMLVYVRGACSLTQAESRQSQ